MLFVDYSWDSIPFKLFAKLVTAVHLQLDMRLPHQQTAGGENRQSPVVHMCLQHGTQQGCVLSPLLYSLFIHDCTDKYSSNIITKSADDTAIQGLITTNDESAY